jgi:hypothetical protein
MKEVSVRPYGIGRHPGRAGVLRVFFGVEQGRRGREVTMRNKSRGRQGTRSMSSALVPGGGASAAAGALDLATAGSGSQQDGKAGWPAWARTVVTVALVFHLCAVLAGALGVPPSSELERAIADGFRPYFDLTDMGYSYRFYTEPPPTPVVTATIQYEDGRPDETVRLPGRDVAGPRMRHQRQLALANALAVDVQEVRRLVKDPSQSRLSRAYARHLCRTRPGCRSVTLHLEQHLIPDLSQVRQSLESSGSPRFDLFAESLFTTPEWVGEFPCDAF